MWYWYLLSLVVCVCVCRCACLALSGLFHVVLGYVYVRVVVVCALCVLCGFELRQLVCCVVFCWVIGVCVFWGLFCVRVSYSCCCR